MNLLIVFILTVFSTAAVRTAVEPPKHITIDSKRLIRLETAVDRQMPKLAHKILKWADPKAKEKKPIDILLASPGGNIIFGAMFVQAIEAAKLRGYTVRCTVTTHAASMAFIIFTYCSERYTLPMSLLLWHEPSVGLMGRFTPSKLDNIKIHLEALVSRYEDHCRKMLKVSDEYYNKHSAANTWHVAHQLKKEVDKDFFVILTDIRGIDKIFKEGN